MSLCLKVPKNWGYSTADDALHNAEKLLKKAFKINLVVYSFFIWKNVAKIGEKIQN